MILDGWGVPTLTPDQMVAILWSACCFVAGVSWAAYRAVGWVERMRSWAHNEPLPEEVETP